MQDSLSMSFQCVSSCEQAVFMAVVSRALSFRRRSSSKLSDRDKIANNCNVCAHINKDRDNLCGLQSRVRSDS